jgi:hypothetical protein
MIGRRPYAAFGFDPGSADVGIHRRRSWTRLMMLILHDDAQREYAYGPAQRLPDTKIGTFTQALYNETKKDSWTIISVKNDRKRIFAFD